MNSFKVKLGIGIMVLIAAFISSQVMYRRNVTVLHDYLSGALSLAEEMHNAETFHSSMHSMLIYARLFIKNNRDFEREEYAQYKKEANGALERLKQHNVKTASLDSNKSTPCLISGELLDAVTARFTSLEKSSDAVVIEGSTTPESSLAKAKMIFDDIFHNYYMKLHENHDMQISRMRESAHKVKAITDFYFAAQLFFALLAGAGVLFYIDNVVLKMHAVTERYALTDSLTSLHNRRHLEKYLPEEIMRSARYKRPFSLALIDIDNFKAFNDNYGHPAGDKLLKNLACIMQSSVRKTDMVARYGGEEFIIVFPELDKTTAIKVAEKIRLAVASHALSMPDLEPYPSVSISIGLAVFPEDGNTVDDIVKKADIMLYKAKNEGKNRVMA